MRGPTWRARERARVAWLGLTHHAPVVASEGERPPAATVRDSAGVRIVESARPAWGDRSHWAVDSIPSITLASWSVPAEDDAAHLQDAVRLADGTIVVANGETGELGYFDRAGRLLLRTGGRGTSPGRSESLRDLHLLDGRVWAFDTMGRWNVFDLRGALVASMYLEPHGGGWGSAEPFGAELAVLGTGGCCSSRETVSGYRRDPTPILRYARAGAALDTLAVLPGHEWLHIVDREGSGAVGLSPFSRRLVIHGGVDRLYAGTAEHMQIGVYGEGGRLEAIFRVPDYDLGLTDRERTEEARRIEEIFRMLRDSPMGPDREFTGDPSVLRPETRPAYARFVEDARGHLWVGEFRLVERTRSAAVGGRREPGSPSTWQIFDPQGAWLGTVRTPAGLSVTQIGPDYVLGIARSEGLDEVRLHALKR